MKSEGKISSIVAAILKRRGIETASEQQDFLDPSYENFKHDPFLMWGMKEAAARILLAKKRGEKITIYGDYDIDGMTATVVLWESLQKFGLEVETYTPDRFTEGYGLNIDAIEQIAKDGTKLIITVDNGTLSFDEIARAKELGVDVIVTDHHSPHEELPDAVAILNPKIAAARNPGAYDEKFVFCHPELVSESPESSQKDVLKKPLKLLPYDEGFPKMFMREKKKLLKMLGETIDIEHVGSTAVKNLSGKGIIDIAIGATDEKDLPKIAEKLAQNGYFFDRDNETPSDRFFLASREHDSTFGDVHLHVVQKNAREWNNLIQFRNLLNSYEKLRTEYERLKQNLAKLTDDNRQKYKHLKGQLIDELMGEFLQKDARFSEKDVAKFVKKLRAENDEIAQKNNKRKEDLYPFADLCGCGVAFKLAQALQMSFAGLSGESSHKIDSPDKPANDEAGLPDGQEKWLLDLVALGTVCDVVGLVDENRTYVKWGLEVLKKTRRPGLKAVLAVAGAELKNVDARTLGFVIGPRLNAAGRLETAKIALELLKTDDEMRALALAEKLEDMNKERRAIQDEIFGLATAQVDENDPVAIAVGENWHEGVIGIVAAKILEKFEKPAFVLSCGAEFAKGSGRSFGEFSCAAAIHATDGIIEKGGGHLAAGGLTVRRERVTEWKMAIQTFYKSLNLKNQKEFLYPAPDLTLMNFADLTMELLDEIKLLEPFGQANPAPVFEFADVVILSRRTMGKNNEHVKYIFADKDGRKLTTVAFGAAGKFTLTPYDSEGQIQHATILVELMANEWNGRVSVEGRLIRMEPCNNDN